MRHIWPASIISLAVAIVETAIPVLASDESQLQPPPAVKEEAQSSVKDLIRLAERGNPEAQILLAQMYDTRKGVAVAHAEASKWYEKAAFNNKVTNENESLGDTDPKAGQGNWHAQHKVATAIGPKAELERAHKLAFGVGASKDPIEAMRLCKLACEGKLPEAQAFLGYLYEHGIGTAPDKDKALAMYKLAAAQENAAALNNIGYMYADGVLLERDYTQAAKYFEQAASKGDACAQCNLGWMYQVGKGVQPDFHRAHELYTEAASKGVVAAQYNLGYMYQYGQGVERDREKSEKFYTTAAGARDINRAQGEDILGFMTQVGQKLPVALSESPRQEPL